MLNAQFTIDMRYDNENLIVQKSKAFALRSIKMYQVMISERKVFILSKQFLRSSTSIGANVKEAIRGQSKADFGAKMNIALKEANESEYWLELLGESGYLLPNESESLLFDCRELLKLLTSIVKSTFATR